MSRRKIREQIFKMLFRVEFYSEKEYEEQMNLFIEENEPIEKPDERYIEDKFNKIIAVLEEIDRLSMNHPMAGKQPVWAKLI